MFEVNKNFKLSWSQHVLMFFKVIEVSKVIDLSANTWQNLKNLNVIKLELTWSSDNDLHGEKKQIRISILHFEFRQQLINQVPRSRCASRSQSFVLDVWTKATSVDLYWHLW